MPQDPDHLTPERWARIEAVFGSAADCEPELRTAFLDQACAGDHELRKEVEGLLMVEPAARGFLQSAVHGAMESLEIAGGSAAIDDGSFTGTERFELRRRLGMGGFGSVYEVYDRKTGAIVALKTLHRAGALDIYRLKREFRSLADIAHENLISLYELLSEGGQWFFTMELVEGTNFLEFVRHGSTGCDAATLRAALAQLATGVCALHESGKVHRDLKPSNVLVTPQGRVVILDFGLTSDVAAEAVERGALAGTPAYMAPERFTGECTSAAADWYAVGVILFEALTGNLPFGCTDLALLEVDSPFPADLAELCGELLRRNPMQRPKGPEILRRLATWDDADFRQSTEPGFVGRDQEVATLRQALEYVRSGEGVAVCIDGPSGVGKSALIRRFLRHTQQEDNALTFSGRCYEQESLPYNALDDLVDGIAAYLRELPRSRLAELMDTETELVGRLFPVLQALTSQAIWEEIDSNELRQAAFGAFRKLLCRLAQRNLFVIHIDDLQWANADSLHFLAEIVRTPEAPKMLLILSMCTEPTRSSPAGGPLTSWVSALTECCRTIRLDLGRLDPGDAKELALQLLPSELHGRADQIAAVVLESGGNPFLLAELARQAGSAAGLESGLGNSLDRMLEARVAKLPEPTLRLLEIVAIAGQPVESMVAWKAGGDLAQQPAWSTLRARRLIRMRRIEDRQEVEIYHDLIRQTVERRLSLNVATERHSSLALALEASGRAAPDVLARHFHRGGNTPKALRYFLAAGDQASKVLAFESAAKSYGLALQLEAESGPGNRAVRVKLAQALGNAGHSSEAATRYLDCLDGAGPAEAVELRRLAAAALLAGGHIQQGLAMLEGVLAGAGMKLPRDAWHALPFLLRKRAQIRIRGLRLKEHDASHADAPRLERLDTCWAVARGLSMVDPIRAAGFHSQHLLMALQAGDPYRMSRSLAMEAGYLSIAGSSGPERPRQILREAWRLAERCPDPHARGLVMLVTGMTAFLEGRWSGARLALADAENFLRNHCAGVAWELATSRLMGCVSLFFLGEIKTLCLRLPVLLQNAQARGDLYESTDLQIRIAHATRLARDQPEIADAEVIDVIGRWPVEGFYLQHWWALMAQTEIALYRGDSAGAWRLINSRWGALRRSLLMRVQYVRIESLFHRALCAVTLASEGTPERRRLSELALIDARAMECQKTRWGSALARLVRAQAAIVDGRLEVALVQLNAAEIGLRKADMQLFAAAARRMQGQLTGGDEGRRLVTEAENWMKSQEIQNPARMARLSLTGLSQVG